LVSLLIVDDSEPERYMIERVSKRSGLFEHIQTAENGEEALNILNLKNQVSELKPPNKLPTIILLDINMPILGGLEFLELFNPGDNPIHIYILSSSSNEEDRLKAQAYPHVKGFLNKPFKKAHLCEIKNNLSAS